LPLPDRPSIGMNGASVEFNESVKVRVLTAAALALTALAMNGETIDAAVRREN